MLVCVAKIGQVMSLKNELHDMKMNDDDSITSYFVRISQLRDQLQAIEDITSEKELVNIVRSLQESVSRAKEKEGETRSIDCRRKGTYKED